MTNTTTVSHSVLANDTFEGLPSLGTQVSGFMTGITPGLIGLIMTLAIIGGVIAVIGAIVFVIRNSVKKKIG